MKHQAVDKFLGANTPLAPRQVAPHLPLIAGLLVLGVAVFAAGVSMADESVYRAGDVLSRDIITPVVLNLVDPVATAALKSSESLKTPAIFISDSAVTNALVMQFRSAFDTTRSNFISALQGAFHATMLDHTTIVSPDFGYLLTAFNFENKQFPITTDLAMDWAYGKDGAFEEQQWLNALLDVMQYPIRPDVLPAGFDMGETVRLVPVTNHKQFGRQFRLDNVTAENAQTCGQLVSASGLATLSQARSLLRRQFSGYDEQPTARALAAWLQPNCLPDATLTRSARDWSVHQLVVGEYYAAGQVIAPKGSVVDSKIKAVLDALSIASASAIAAVPPIRETREPQVDLNVSSSNSPALVAADTAPAHLTKTSPEGATTGPVLAIQQANLKSKRLSDVPYITWPKAMGAFAVAMLAMVAGRIRFQRGQVLAPTTSVRDVDAESKNMHLLQTELAPQLVQIVRQAFVQELAGQRRDLLVAQQTAASEVIRLVHRMDALQVAMQERLRTYESQIQTLEAELTARTDENRQLIRLKIQMIRHQVEAESGVKRIEFN